MPFRKPWTYIFVLTGVFGLLGYLLPLAAQVPVGNLPRFSLRDQQYQRPEACLPCHQRQYDELQTSVKSGYRNVSPLFNGLETAANFLSGGRLRPIYKDSTKLSTDNTPLKSNLASTDLFTHVNQVQAAFCLTCHNANIVLLGDNPQSREVPELDRVGADFQPESFRPLRDFHLVGADGRQVLPLEPGGEPPPLARPSMGASGVSCDFCHNVMGPHMEKSFQHDGFANMSLRLTPTISKVGPFLFPAAVKGEFHVASRDPERIAFLRSANLCNGCHDVRVPGDGSLTAFETDINSGGAGVTHYRLENLSTEWAVGPYNSTNNPFGKVMRCQDCHMSLFPYGGNSSYEVAGQKITSPTPGVFPQDFAAVPGVSTEFNFPLPRRQVVTHYLTGVDVPLLPDEEMRARLGHQYPGADEAGVDEHGIPKSLVARRADLLRAAVRISLDKTDRSVRPDGTFRVRVTATALTGHRFPAGFSQERTTYIELKVKDRSGFLIYQSGYQVDKPHAMTGEMTADGNLDDEDLEHVIAVPDPGRHADSYTTGPDNNGHTNQVFYLGPDNGPESRVFTGRAAGLVLFRNELSRIFLPGNSIGRPDAEGRPITMSKPHWEETFSAAFANSVDNFRSLQPLRPTTYRYDIKLPAAKELRMLGLERLEGPLQIEASVHFEHFPPLFVRFLARTTGPEGPAAIYIC